MEKDVMTAYELANVVTMWVAIINAPLLLLIIRMLWGFNNRLTIIETRAAEAIRESQNSRSTVTRTTRIKT